MSNNEDDFDKLRRIVLEETIKASRQYILKERVREEIQNMIISRVTSGEIKNEGSLLEFWKTLEMAINALKMVPLNAFVGSKK